MKRFMVSQYNDASPACETGGEKRRVPATGSVCPICGGAGCLRLAVSYGDPAFGRSRTCACSEVQLTAQLLQQRRQAANLDALDQYTFETFNEGVPGVQDALRACIEYAVNPMGWLLLTGPCGCGKTHLAVSVAKQRLGSGAEVFFATVPDLPDALRATLSSTERYAQLFARVREVELLVLDDLGAQQISPWSNEKLLQLLDARAKATLSTLITAIPKEFQGLDERLRSRLTDAQLVTTVRFEHARDFRLHKQVTKRSTRG